MFTFVRFHFKVRLKPFLTHAAYVLLLTLFFQLFFRHFRFRFWFRGADPLIHMTFVISQAMFGAISRAAFTTFERFEIRVSLKRVWFQVFFIPKRSAAYKTLHFAFFQRAHRDGDGVFSS